MARIRTVKPEFFQHEELGALPFAARLLAIGLMQIADGHGRLRWVPKQIEAHVFPWDDVDLETLAAGLDGVGFLHRYSVGGRLFATLPNFRKHQRITGKEAALASKYPAQDDAEEAGGSAVNAQGNSGETPGCFPGKQLDAQEQGTGNREQGTGNGRQADRADSQPFLLNPEAPRQTPAEVAGDYYRAKRGQTTALALVAKERIQTLLTKGYTVDQICLVVDWSHDAPTAAHLKDNAQGKDYTRWTTVFGPEKFAGYIEEAEEWRDGGKPTSTPAQAQNHESWWTGVQAPGSWVRGFLVSAFDIHSKVPTHKAAVEPTEEGVLAFIRGKYPDAPPDEWLRPKVAAWLVTL